MVMFRGLLAHRGPSPGATAVIDYAAQAKPVRFESAGASTLHTHLLVLIQVMRRRRKAWKFDRQRCADYTAIAGTFCRSVGARSTTQPWRAGPLTPTLFYLGLSNIATTRRLFLQMFSHPLLTPQKVYYSPVDDVVTISHRLAPLLFSRNLAAPSHG